MVSTNAQATVDSASDGHERRARLAETIDSLIKIRQEMFVSYCQMAGVSAFDRRHIEKNTAQRDQLRSFCQIMVDYTAMGHFEVYQRIIEDKERRTAVKEVAQRVYPSIAKTTDYLVDFNDKYDDFNGSDEDLENLQGDLSRLGEVIAERGELEDEILAALAAR